MLRVVGTRFLFSGGSESTSQQKNKNQQRKQQTPSSSTATPGVLMETKLKALVQRLADIQQKVRVVCRRSVPMSLFFVFYLCVGVWCVPIAQDRSMCNFCGNEILVQSSRMFYGVYFVIVCCCVFCGSTVHDKKLWCFEKSRLLVLPNRTPWYRQEVTLPPDSLHRPLSNHEKQITAFNPKVSPSVITYFAFPLSWFSLSGPCIHGRSP